MSDAAADAPKKLSITTIIYLILVAAAIALAATGAKGDGGIEVLGAMHIPFAFVLFVLVLVGVAFFHHYTLYVALTGALVITLYTALVAPATSLSSEAFQAHIDEATVAKEAPSTPPLPAHAGRMFVFHEGDVAVEVVRDRAAGTLTLYTVDTKTNQDLMLRDAPTIGVTPAPEGKKFEVKAPARGDLQRSSAWQATDDVFKSADPLQIDVSVHRPGLLEHFKYESIETLLNLLGLLLGFALLAKFFEHSNAPDALPRLLPKSPLWSGFVLLAIVWFVSSFLDNIAAAMIGGVMAKKAFKGRVTVGYVAAIVAASNAGGAWSVVGDTTTTMMWIDGVSPLDVAHGIISSTVALLCFGLLSSAHQNKVQPMEFHPDAEKKPIDWVSILIVALILAGAITTNFLLDKPFVGVWIAILIGALMRKPAWGEIPGAAKGSMFLLSLVWCASLMPVEALPPAGWPSAFVLGFVSAVFDNIPLTKLALEQGGYDWGMLAYTVGFGGSMIWFGSSAGVAISKDFPEARSTARYVKEGWPVAVAYVIGFFVLLGTVGFHAHPPHRTGHDVPAAVEHVAK